MSVKLVESKRPPLQVEIRDGTGHLTLTARLDYEGDLMVSVGSGPTFYVEGDDLDDFVEGLAAVIERSRA